MIHSLFCNFIRRYGYKRFLFVFRFRFENKFFAFNVIAVTFHGGKIFPELIAESLRKYRAAIFIHTVGEIDADRIGAIIHIVKIQIVSGLGKRVFGHSDLCFIQVIHVKRNGD